MHSIQSLRVLFGMLAFGTASSCVAAGIISGRVIDRDDKGIAQAVVFVQSPVEPVAVPTASAPRMDQVDKTFVPGVLPVVVGTQVAFPNSDDIRHHVYSFSRAKSFELPLYKGQEAPPVLFDKPGLVKIGCNIHDWMSAIILVLPNSYYATTDTEGRFSLPELKSGTYTLTAWHPQGRDKTESIAQQVELAESNVGLTFKLALSPVRARPPIRGAR